MFTLAIGLILAWKVAGYYGLDRYVLPMLGTPWQPRPGLPSPRAAAERFARRLGPMTGLTRRAPISKPRVVPRDPGLSAMPASGRVAARSSPRRSPPRTRVASSAAVRSSSVIRWTRSWLEWWAKPSSRRRRSSNRAS